MLQGSSSEQDPNDSDADFVEVDPSGRYGRYKEVLGKGSFKKVYKGFDEWEGIEVAWNQIKVADLLRNSEDADRLYSEVNLLNTLKHKNIIKLYDSWVDDKNGNINFITEIFTSGTLRQYRKKHKHVDLRALKKWSRQILEGLLYLHSHDPPVIHRDLKCDNIFINGNQGEVKIGDLGLAAILQQARLAHSVIGTPEFMAPELYEEEYNELVDIYAFGMCLLELVTFEYPYIECANAAQIFKKVTSGIKPASLAKVTDPGIKEFIEKCIANVADRLPAKELLEDPFLKSYGESESVGRSLQTNHHSSDGGDQRTENEEDPPSESRDFMVEGKRKDINTIFLKLRMADSTGHVRNIHFPFDIEADTVLAVASEMVEELKVKDPDIPAVAAMIESEIYSLIPDWIPKDFTEEDKDDTNEVVSMPEEKDDSTPLPNPTLLSASNLVLERTFSGRNYWSDSPKGTGEYDSPGKSSLNTSFPDYVASGENSPSKSLFEEKRNVINGMNLDDFARYLGFDCDSIEEIESEDVRNVMMKLENLVTEQQKELDELKRKHELNVMELLKDLPQELHEKIPNLFNLEINDQEHGEDHE